MWLFKEEGDNCRVAKCENDWKPEAAELTFIAKKKSILYAFELLFHFLAHKTVTIGTLEVNINFDGNIELQTDIEKVQKIVGDRFLRAQKLVWPKESIRFGYQYFYTLCDPNEIRTQEYMSMRLSSQNLVPVTMYFDKIYNTKHNPICKTDLFLATPTPDTINRAKAQLLLHIEQYDKKGYDSELGDFFRVGTYCEVYSMSRRGYRVPPPSSHRRVEEGIVMHTLTSKCGTWTNMYPVEHEAQYKTYYKDQKCGLGILCKRCSDPFDYWYHQTFSQRIIRTGSSIVFFHVAGINDDAYDREIELLGKKLKESEAQKEKNRNQKYMKKNSQKMPSASEQKSWGFDAQYIPAIKHYLVEAGKQNKVPKKFIETNYYISIVFGVGAIITSFFVYLLYSVIYFM